MKSISYTSQKRIIYWIISIGIIFLLAANTLAWIYLQRIKSYFEDDLKFRMENIVQISGKLFDAVFLSTIIPGDENDPQIIYYQQLLYDIKERNDLQDIFIISPAKDLLVDVNPDYIIGEITRTLDSGMFREALAGKAGSSEIYLLGDHKFLSAAVPLLDETNSVSAILVAEARAEFFNIFEEFNNGLLLFSIINALVVLTVAYFLFRSLKSLVELQNRIKNQEHLVKLGEMAAAVAHEIRNPLGIIRGTNEMIQKKYGNKDDEFFEYIPLELNRLNKLINNFLSFARTKDLQFEEVDIEFLLAKLKIGFSDNSEIIFDINIDEKVKTIRTDPDALEQILLNILQNSIQAVNHKGKIEIRAFLKNKNYYAIHIKDNGCGINPEAINQVFEPFFSTKDKGSGLGLSISKRLVEQLGGEILINSVFSNGTTVEIILPKTN